MTARSLSTLAGRLHGVGGGLALASLAAGCFVDTPAGESGSTGSTGSAASTGSSTGETAASDPTTTTAASSTTGDPAVCGDGKIEGDEECDSGELNGGASLCKVDCTVNVCGDGVVSTIEACDDGNAIDDDACSNQCELPRCGDGVVQAGEGCDDGGVVDGDGCSATCTAEGCGDGAVQDREECDDGNMTETDACTSLCKLAACGDGFLQPGEECDDGVDNGANAPCSSACVVQSCGDGILQPGEGCDDGNLIDGDGCSATCVRDALYVFVTDKTYSGSLGGIDGADMRCQLEADDAGLGGTYRAWISSGETSPLSTFTQSKIPYVRLDGVAIAADWDDLTDGEILALINVTATKGLLASGGGNCGITNAVWTNTKTQGGVDGGQSCGNWADSGQIGFVGRFDRMDGGWTDAGCSMPCFVSLRLYCFEQ